LFFIESIYPGAIFELSETLAMVVGLTLAFPGTGKELNDEIGKGVGF